MIPIKYPEYKISQCQDHIKSFLTNYYCSQLHKFNDDGFKFDKMLLTWMPYGQIWELYQFVKDDNKKFIIHVYIYSSQFNDIGNTRHKILGPYDGNIITIIEDNQIVQTYKKDLQEIVNKHEETEYNYNKTILEKMKLPDIKKICLENGIKRTGYKDLLINRIIFNQYKIGNLIPE